MAIAAAENSPMLRDKAGQNSTDWFEDIAQRVTQTLETSVPSDTIECDNSTITNELEVPHRHTGAHIRQCDKQTQPDAKPLKTGNDTELDYENIALQYVSQTYDIPIEELFVTTKTQRHFPYINKRIWCVCMHMKKPRWHEGIRSAYTVCMDLDGNIVDISKLREQDQKAYREKYGKLNPPLYDRLQSMQPNETIRVAIWMTAIDSKRIEREVLSKYPNIEIIDYSDPLVRAKYPNLSSSEYPNWVSFGLTDVLIKGQLNRTEIEKIRQEIRAAKKEAYALKEKPLVDYLTAKGYGLTGTATMAPIVGATLPKEEIITLQERGDIAKIYPSVEYNIPCIDTAVRTIRAHEVWSGGWDGTGAKIAIVEDKGVDFANPYLHGYMGPDTDIGWHPTGCIGVATSYHPNDPTYRGVAYNATILSANADSPLDIDIINATEWVINEYAQVLSCSILEKGSNLFGKDFIK